MSSSAERTYAMGRSVGETRRLITAGALYEDNTRRLFEQAGIGLGMKVLDVGSGAGDVGLLTAELVGPTGSVVGVDTNPAVLNVGRERALDSGLANVRFVEGDAETVELPNDFDAVVGRAVLI
jgi:ubiquinone/menaquinone biosynthesis C-methylase UbiE